MQDSPRRPDGGPDRRANQVLTTEIVKYIDHAVESKVREFANSAMPDGDVARHKAEHLQRIESARDRQALWKSVWEKVLTGGIWSAVALLATAAAEGAKQWLQR